MSANRLTEYLLQVDTFDEELKKLVGMGFEKVFQALSFSIAILHLYSSQLAYQTGLLFCHVLAVSDHFILRSSTKWLSKQMVCFPYWLCVFTCVACFFFEDSSKCIDIHLRL